MALEVTLDSAKDAVSEIPVSSGLRPMVVSDIPEIEDMFFKIFRPERNAVDPKFREYFQRLFFGGPHGEAETGGLVSREGDAIASAIAFMPITYCVNGRELTARLACAFMSNAPHSKAAARVVLSLRARSQDLLFTDSAASTSAAHWLAGGGMLLPVQSLDWQAVFRPASYSARRMRLPQFLDPVFAIADLAISSRRSNKLADSGVTDAEVDLATYADMAPSMISHFAVRPKWDRDEITWQLKMASENSQLGKLRFFSVGGELGLGCYAYYTGKRGVVRVIDVLARSGKEAEVVRALYNRLRSENVVEARGGAHPHLLVALSPLPGMKFRHRSYTCVATRHQDIRDAITRQDIYIGGLAGESWSRLMTDFF